MRRREALKVLANEAVGPYALLRLERGGLDPGIPGQFFMLEAPGRVLPRPMSLCQAPPGELTFLLEAVGPGTRALAAVEPGEAIHVFGPLGNGYRLDVEQPLLVGGGIGVAPFPYLSEQLGSPPAILGFRSDWHAEAAALVPNATVVVEPTLVTEPLRDLATDCCKVLACGPEPMLEAVRELVPDAQLAWEAPMACGYGACYGCSVEIDGVLQRLCVAGPGSGGRMILNASGCLDALEAPEVARALDAFVTKTVTPQPREGNRPVRIAETEAGMLNSIGLENPGIEALLADKLPRLGELGVPIWVSVGGFAASDYAEICAALDDRDEVATIELNLSCPNVDEAPESAAEIVAAARLETRKPLYAKLSPAASDLPETARAVQAAGADGLSLVNTIRGLALDEKTLQPRARARARRVLRPGPEADRAGRGLPVLPGDRAADRGHGRDRDRA